MCILDSLNLNSFLKSTNRRIGQQKRLTKTRKSNFFSKDFHSIQPRFNNLSMRIEIWELGSIVSEHTAIFITYFGRNHVHQLLRVHCWWGRTKHRVPWIRVVWGKCYIVTVPMILKPHIWRLICISIGTVYNEDRFPRCSIIMWNSFLRSHENWYLITTYHPI